MNLTGRTHSCHRGVGWRFRAPSSRPACGARDAGGSISRCREPGRNHSSEKIENSQGGPGHPSRPESPIPPRGLRPLDILDLQPMGARAAVRPWVDLAHEDVTGPKHARGPGSAHLERTTELTRASNGFNFRDEGSKDVLSRLPAPKAGQMSGGPIAVRFDLGDQFKGQGGQ